MNQGRKLEKAGGQGKLGMQACKHVGQGRMVREAGGQEQGRAGQGRAARLAGRWASMNTPM